MDTSRRRIFCECAEVSGLVTAVQLDEAMRMLRPAVAGLPAATVEVTDEELADKLVEIGALHPYQADQLLAGHTKFNLGPYIVIDSIGQGGMGQVFKAEHTMMGRIVAIKVLPKNKTTPSAIESFTREIRVLAQLDHANLVRAFDAGKDGNVYYLVTEYVPGTDLRRLVRSNGKLSVQEAATIISQAAQGLAHAHGRGLIHRDVKPGNLLVTPDGHTKVSDLGLAGFLNDEDSDDPRRWKIVGTADYLSPEQIKTPGDLTPSSDIYALGCTLYYAITGKVPFPGGTTREKARCHCEEIPMHPRRRNPAISDELADVLADMMDKDPRRRLQTCEEVVERLSRWATDAVETTRLPQPPPPPHTSRPSRMPPPLPAEIAGAEEPPLPDTGPFNLRVPDTQRGSQESQSQTSQGTHSMAAATEDTRRVPPIVSPQSRPLRRPRRGLGGLLVRIVLMLAGIAIVAAAAWWMVTSGFFS